VKPPVVLFSAAEVSAAFARGAVLLDDDGRRFQVHAGRREAPGEAEVHAEDTDIFHVLAGAAALATGGIVVDAREIAPGEVRGRALAGGETHNLAAGDVIVIPAGTPHQFTAVEATLTYFVVKSR
jgi:mannose-6-phosphate isomerase-like protein (cupin superfamily)